ncbi:MAG: hypothetical protein IJA29_10050 [Lachnospiraceae bacterium]|nr:hypothetical protein [Lachnospiraceae bacterium]
MAININANHTALGIKGILTPDNANQDKRNAVFAGNKNVTGADPIQAKRAEAQKKAMKVVGDAWDTDKEIDKSIEERRDHYQEMLALKNEAQSQINDINDQVDALKKEYGVTEETDYKDWPPELKQAYSDLREPMDELKKQIEDADKMMKDDVADIRQITLERLKSNPMLDAQNTADAIYAAADEEIIGMVMQEAKDNIEEKMEEAEEKAEEAAEQKEIKEEKLEDIQEKRALQEAMIEQTKEAVEKAKAQNQENNTPDIPLEDLMKIARANTETSKAQKSLQEIKNSMSLLEADLTGIEVDTEV